MVGCSEKRKETVQVIGELIAAWVIPFEISSVVDNGAGSYTLNVPKTYYLQAGKRRKLTIGAIEYEVTSVVNNSSVTIFDKSAIPTLPATDTFNLPVPFFFNGTIIQTNTELAKEKKIWEKTPMVYLQRPFSETIDANDLTDSFTANKAALTLRFLTEADFAEWSTAQHDLHAVVPMRNLMYEFIEMLKANAKYIDRFSDYEATDLIKFGVVTQKGYEGKGLFSDNYSGVQLDITLGIKYQCICPPAAPVSNGIAYGNSNDLITFNGSDILTYN